MTACILCGLGRGKPRPWGRLPDGRTTMARVCRPCAGGWENWSPPAPRLVTPMFNPERYTAAIARDLEQRLEVNKVLGRMHRGDAGNHWHPGDETQMPLAPAAWPGFDTTPPWSKRDDIRMLSSIRGGHTIEETAAALEQPADEIERRLDALCPEPRNPTTVGAVLKRLRDNVT